MNEILALYNKLSRRIRVSATFSVTAIGLVSTVMSVTGGTLYEWTDSWLASVVIVAVALAVLFAIAYCVIGWMYKDSVSITVRQTPVTVRCGDLFSADGMRVITCDSRFDTRVDDVVISKGSLHGKLFLEHGNISEIEAAVARETKRQHLEAAADGRCDFPLGSVVRYDSSVDGGTYLMLSACRLDDDYMARTNMAEFEHMLMTMWKEIDRVYAGNKVAIPLLGSGILRFSDVDKSREILLRCILCTLNASGVTLSSSVEVVLYEDAKGIPLFEYKDMFRSFTIA